MAKKINYGLRLHQINRLAKKVKGLKLETERALTRYERLVQATKTTESRFESMLGGSDYGSKRRGGRRRNWKASAAGRRKITAGLKKYWAAKRAKKAAAA